jgi:hypothetical protein
VWSKSWTQSVTGGCSGMTLTESDIGQLPLLCSFRLDVRQIGVASRLNPFPSSFLGNFDRELGAIAFGKPGLVLQALSYDAVAVLMRVAEFIEIEQFGRQRLAARVALTLVLIDVDFQLSGHCYRSLAHAHQLRALLSSY